MPEFISSYKSYSEITGDAWFVRSPPSLATLGDSLLVAYQTKRTSVHVVAFALPSLEWLKLSYLTQIEGYKAPTIAVFPPQTDNLYCGFDGDNTQLNISQFSLDGSIPNGITKLATAVQGSDGFPILYASQGDLLMAWQSKDSPSHLNICGFPPPPTPRDFLVGFHYFSQFDVLSPPTMAIWGNLLYVAFRTTGDHLCVVVFDHSVGLNQPIYTFKDTTYDRCRGGSIVEFQNKLYVAFGDNYTRLNIGRLELDGSGFPQSFILLGTAMNDTMQSTDSFPTLFATKWGMLIAWQIKKENPLLAIGNVVVP
jgi:hypothetical protein